MNLKEIMAISGKPGLYKLVGQAKNGIIVESITDGKRFQAYTHDKISTLEEISIFTDGEDMPMKQVLKAFYDHLEGKATDDFKGNNDKLKTLFGEAVPAYDKERVYTSHMQKIVNWYNLLQSHDMLDFTEEEEETETAETGDHPEAPATDDVKDETVPETGEDDQ